MKIHVCGMSSSTQNDRIVQGHHVHCLVSRVHILLQGKVQRVTPTSPMKFQMLYSITREGLFVLSLADNFIHVGNCRNFLFCLNEVNTFRIPFD